MRPHPRRRRRGRMRLYAPRERNEASFRDGVVPTQDKAIDDDEKRVRLHRKYEAERLSQQAPKKAPKHCYLPAPIPEGKKPQDDLKYVYLSTDEDDKECKATWHSRTVEIDYGEFKAKELKRRQQHDPTVEIVTVYRKEVFTLQACGPIDEEDPESEVVPLYGRHRKHLRIEDDEPVPAPFDDLLPCDLGVPWPF